MKTEIAYLRLLLSLLLILLLVPLSGLWASTPGETPADPPSAPTEMRGLWIATVANIDWPSEPGLPAEQQQEELIRILDRAAALNLNAVIFQIRPAGDALYNSPYEPWSPWLTGEMGKAPDPWYDPLEFAVTEAHSRGLELHAWLNPYRVHHPSDPGDGFTDDHITQTHPHLVREYGDYLWLDPGLEEVRELTLRVILDVVERYDIDAIHLDDYFYPYPSYADGADFPDNESWQRAREAGVTLSREEWRRNNVNRMMKEIYDAIGETDRSVRFGLSPFGIWRPGHPEGTFGFDAYSELYADSRHWIREGWIDYFSPQIYYPIAEPTRPFPVMLEWWIDQNRHNRHLWPGMRTRSVLVGQDPFYPDDPGWPPDEIVGKVYISRSNPDVSGSLHYSTEPLMTNPDRLVEKLSAGPYARPALPPAYPWIDETPPPRPAAELREGSENWLLTLQPDRSLEDHEIRWWVVRSLYGDRWQIDLVPGTLREMRLAKRTGDPLPNRVTVSMTDRIGNESEAADVDLPEAFSAPLTGGSIRRATGTGVRDSENAESSALDELPNLVRRSEWNAGDPGGVDALAVRVLLERDRSFGFRDLSLAVTGLQRGDCPGGGGPDGSVSAESVQRQSGECTPDRVTVRLQRNGVEEQLEIASGEARNWYGYRLVVTNVHSAADHERGEGPLADLEIAATGSLDVQHHSSPEAGTERFRVPHRPMRVRLQDIGQRSGESRAETLRDLLDEGIRSGQSWDVPWHFAVDRDGVIYEGRDYRYAGDPMSLRCRNGEEGDEPGRGGCTGDPRGALLVHLYGSDPDNPSAAQQEALESLRQWVETHFVRP